MKKSIILFFGIALMTSASYAQSSNSILFYSGNVKQSVMADEAPRIKNYKEVMDQIDYPSNAIKACKEGLVQVSILVDQEGNYATHEISASPYHSFEEAISPYLEKLKFEPARKNGKNVQAWVSVPFRFRMMK